MGNSIVELISKNLEELKKLVFDKQYKNAFDTFKETYKKLVGVQNENAINFLLSNVTNNNKFLFSIIIGNLKNTDKICYLYHLIYEQTLIDSIEKEIEENDNIENNNSKILDQKQREKELLVKKISNIIEVNNYVGFIYFKSYLYELLAEKYYDLANMNYYRFIRENNESLEEIQEIIDQFSQCKENYMNSKNYKKLLDVYTKAYDKVVQHKKLLTGIHKYKDKNYLEALKYLDEIESKDPQMLAEKNYRIYLCNEKLGELEKENKNYEKALEYFMKSKNNFQIFQLKLLINEKKIINCIKGKKFEDSFTYFNEIFNSYNTARISYDEKKYTDIYTIFIELMIKLSLFYYEKKNIKEFQESVKETINKINNKETKYQIEELIIELKNIESIEKKELYKYIVDKLMSKDLSEIKQRFYLSFLVQIFFNEKTLEVLSMLLKADINLNYLSLDAFNFLKAFLKTIKIDYLEEFFLISKLFYKIIVSLGKFNRLDCLTVLGEKIKEINKIPNIADIYQLNGGMENLIYCFQEIMINNKNIKSYEGHKNLLLLIFSKNNTFINCISNGLVFLSENKIVFEKKYVLKLKDYLIQNENGNLLQCLLLQFKLQPLILSDDISIIYEILFFYQKLKNSNETQKIIFEFLLTLDKDIICSKDSILNLEKYSKEGNIEPLFYVLIEKIPLKVRGIYLSQKLLDYNENKNKHKIKITDNNFKSQIAFKIIFQKEDLPLVEKYLDDPKILEKLVYSLKQQKYLYEELNIDNITKSYSSSKKELFNLLIENKINFKERALTNLLQGFYKNNNLEVKETFNIFNKIKEYETFSEIIKINLKIEEFLFSKEYLKINNFNNELFEIINNFSFLFGFSSQHESFILFILDLPSNANNKLIIDKMIELLIVKHFDVGVNIFTKIVKSLSKDEFIELSRKILSNDIISFNIKNLTLKYLYSIIKGKSKEYKNIIFQSFKFFIDRIKIPDIFLKYLITYLKGEKDDNDTTNKEILFFLGIYFSIPKSKQESYLKEIISIYENNEIYKYLINHIKSIKKQNHMFYLFSNLYYYGFNLGENNEEKLLELPKKYLIEFIKTNFKEIVNENFEPNIIYMEEYFEFGVFSPKRDEILRKLFFNGDKNAVNNLRLICH